MLTSISPLGERARGNRYGLTVAAYVLGSALGGALTGAVLGTVGWLLALPRTAAVLLGAAGCALALASDLARRTYGHRQVSEDWLTAYRGWVYGLGFGVQLGLGVTTVVTSAATFALLLLAVLTGSPLAGLGLGVAFGLVRALPLLSLRAATTPDALRHAARRLEGLARPAAGATAGVLGLSSLALLVLA